MNAKQTSSSSGLQHRRHDPRAGMRFDHPEELRESRYVSANVSGFLARLQPPTFTKPSMTPSATPSFGSSALKNRQKLKRWPNRLLRSLNRSIWSPPSSACRVRTACNTGSS